MKENVVLPASAVFAVNVRAFDERVREDVLGALRRVIGAEAAGSIPDRARQPLPVLRAP